MLLRRGILSCLAGAGLAMPAAALAEELTIVEVAAPAINCVYRADCKVEATDSVGNIRLPDLKPGAALLQSRTFPAEAGAPAGAGTVGYEYRIDMARASGVENCVVSFTLNFGPNKPLRFKGEATADVYVITQGGLGTIGLKSAERFGDVIEFTLARALCADGPASDANTTVFIGLAAGAAPMHGNARLAVTGKPPILLVDARVPTHPVAGD
jgi:hypothetical protein